jgi:pseudouridine-5'-phosphate glycosidase
MIAARVGWASRVSAAVESGRPVVALESTVIGQGLPWPENLETARAMEREVRQIGAEPATLAVSRGVVRIGLEDDELVAIARTRANEPTTADAIKPGAAQGFAEGVSQSCAAWAKAGRRDLAPFVAAGGSATTTVSATLWVARRFGLKPYVMATGGLGGVHRDAALSFDISTDLDELARADGALVVCSGPKSILDVPGTLEALETRGVLVVGYRTSELAGFLARTSGLLLDHRVDSPGEAAELVRSHRELGLPGAVVLTQPVPEEQALEPDLLRSALDLALDDARRRGITGKPLTPFLLEGIQRATAGRALRANCELLAANARLAAQVAVALGESRGRTGCAG